MKPDNTTQPTKDMSHFASFFSRNTNIGISIYIEIRDYEIDITDNIALKAIPNRTRKFLNACNVIFSRSGEIIEARPNKHGQVLTDNIYGNLQAWIRLNIEPLVLHWDCEISTGDFCRRHKKLPKKLKQELK